MPPSKRRRSSKSAPRATQGETVFEKEVPASAVSAPPPEEWHDEAPAPHHEPAAYHHEPAAPASAFVAPEAYAPPSQPAFEPAPQAYEPPPRPARGRDRYQQQVPEVERIGDILRRAREERREDLLDVADYLRIRPNFLAALEACQYEDLPADAYVIGFLRSYANYLGLDGKKAIDYYRREMTGRRRKPQLSMPQPVSEGKAPTVAILIAAALGALAVYGLWYVLATSDRAEVTAPPTLPEKVTTAPEQLPLTASGVQAVPTPEAAAPGNVDGSAAVIIDPSAPNAPTTEGIVVPGVPQNAPMPAKEIVKEAPKDAQKDAPGAKEDKPKDEAKPKDDKPKDEAKPADDAAAKPKADGASFGADAPGRVVIKAARDSWVLITDSHGNTLFDKTLKAGDSYQVPDDKNLNMTTGNAAGLEVSIDGAVQPRMTSSKRVVRAVPLDPERLKSRISEMNAQ